MYYAPFIYEDTKGWSLVLHKPGNAGAVDTLDETTAGALNLAPEWLCAKHALCLLGGQLLTLSDPLVINSWGLAKSILSTPRANKYWL